MSLSPFLRPEEAAAEQVCENDLIKDALRKKYGPHRRAERVVRDLVDSGLSERRALAVVGMSASSLRYTPEADRNGQLRERILALAHRHRRHEVGI